MKPEDPENQNMKTAQVAQNKMLRMLDGVSLKEHISVVYIAFLWQSGRQFLKHQKVIYLKWE